MIIITYIINSGLGKYNGTQTKYAGMQVQKLGK